MDGPDGSRSALTRRRFLSSVAAPLALAMLTQAGGHKPEVAPRRNRYTSWTFPPIGTPAIRGVRHQVFTAKPEGVRERNVIVMHEITGATDEFFAYTDTLV